MDLNRILQELKTERDRISAAITALEASNRSQSDSRGSQRASANTRSRRLSPAARKRISDAQKARWAAQRQTRPPAKAQSAGRRKRRNMSPAARRKLSQMMKARWAARKKAGASEK